MKSSSHLNTQQQDENISPLLAAVCAGLSVLLMGGLLLYTPQRGSQLVRDHSLLVDPEQVVGVYREVPDPDLGSVMVFAASEYRFDQRTLVNTYPRVGFRFAQAGEIHYATRLIAPADLCFGLGVEVQAATLPVAAVPCRFWLDVETPRDGRKRLFERALYPPMERWSEERVALDRFVNHPLTLIFGCDAPQTAGHAPVAGAFAAPAIRHRYAPMTQRTFKNVLLIVIDTQRYDTIGFNGNPHVETPAYDRLMREHAVVFDNYRAAAPWTLPSFCAMLTGAYPCFSGEVESDLLMQRRAETTTLAEMFRRAGYATMAATTNYIMDHFRRFDVGFDVYHFERFITAPQASEEIIHWLERHRGSPFFVMAHFNDPHTPYGDRGGHPIHGNLRLEEEPFVHLYYPLGMNGTTFAVRSRNFTEEEIGQIIKLYQDDVNLADEGVGRLLRYLDESGLRETTLVVFTADHGEEFWEHGSFEHGHTCYDELVHCPLAFSHPTIQGRRSDTPIGAVDLAPTILELAGVDPAPYRAQFQGVSYAGYIRHSEPAPESRYILTATAVEHNALRYDIDRQTARFLWERAEIETPADAEVRGKLMASMALVYYPTQEEVKSVVVDTGVERFKYILNCFSKQEEIYDLLTDPGEERDLMRADDAVRRDAERWLLHGRRGLLAVLTAPMVPASPPRSYRLQDGIVPDAIRHNPYLEGARR